MKPSEINIITDMRLKGQGASAIAAALRLSPNTVKSYIRRHPDLPGTHCCVQCGNTFSQPTGRREKRFCSDKCRTSWWNAHQEQINKKAYYTLVCQYCGKEFESYGNKNRKYCSRTCYQQSRGKQLG